MRVRTGHVPPEGMTNILEIHQLSHLPAESIPLFLHATRLTDS